MSNWVKVFNSLPAHPKILRAGDRAAWLFVCGLCYSNEHLTDGFIAREVLVVAAPGVKNPERLARNLVEVGLWDTTEGGWQVHDYGDYQRTSQQVKDVRRKDRERKGYAESDPEDTGDSERNPNGIQKDSERGLVGIPSRPRVGVPSQEEKREERTTPKPPAGGQTERGRLIAFRRRPVSDDVRTLAEAILADFNQQAGTNYSAYTAEGRPSEDLKRILGAISDATPPLALAEAARITHWRLTAPKPFWTGRPHTGVVFGPNVFPSNRESAISPTSNTPTSRELAAAFDRSTSPPAA